jgi:hypothetical protein
MENNRPSQSIKLTERDMIYLHYLGQRSTFCKINQHEDCAHARTEGRYVDCKCGCHLVEQT